MKIGDMVRSKAGGPRMVVSAEIGTTRWTCVWWSVKEGAFKSQDFHPNALVQAEEAESPGPRASGRGVRNPGL